MLFEITQHFVELPGFEACSRNEYRIARIIQVKNGLVFILSSEVLMNLKTKSYYQIQKVLKHLENIVINHHYHILTP